MALLEISDLHAHGPAPRADLLDGLAACIERGESVAFIGEEGSGLSLLPALLFKLAKPSAGELLFNGLNISKQRGAALREIRRQIALLSGSEESLNPWRSAEWVIGEPLSTHFPKLNGNTRHPIVRAAVELAGFDPILLPVPVAELDDDHRARVSLARALVAEPELIILDHPWADLDPLARRRIISTLTDLREELGLSLLLLTDDLYTAADLCQSCTLVREGIPVESASPQHLLLNPAHRYTRHMVETTPALS